MRSDLEVPEVPDGPVMSLLALDFRLRGLYSGDTTKYFGVLDVKLYSQFDSSLSD